MHPVGSVEDELGGAAAMGRRVRRNRRRLAGEVDRDLELLGELGSPTWTARLMS